MHAIANCVFWENRASGQLSHIPASTTGFLSATSSLIQDDDPDDAPIPFGGAANGNIDDNPVFVRTPDAGTNGWGDADDDYGDLRPSAGSPCIDAGSNGAVSPDETDLDCDGNKLEPTPQDINGLPRFVDGDSDSEVIVDMGAYEFGSFVGSRIFVDASTTGVNDGSSWADAFVNLQDALDAASNNGCGALEIWVAAHIFSRPRRGASAR